MGHNCVAAMLTLLHGLQALAVLADALAGNGPEAQLCLMCLLWLPDASIVHLTFTSESQIAALPPLSAPGTTPRCGREIPLYSVHIIAAEATGIRRDPGNQGPDGIGNIPVLSGCKFQPPLCHVHPLKMCLEELPCSLDLHFTEIVRALMLLRRKDNLP